MYWYIKYPLLFLLVFALGGLAWWGLRHRSGPPDTAVTPSPAAAVAPAATPTTGQGSPLTPLSQPTKPVVVADDPQLRAAFEKLRAEEPLAARELAFRYLNTAQPAELSPLWLRAAAIISHANIQLFTTNTPAPEKVRCVIQPGDTLIGIANRYTTTVAAIERANQLNSARMAIYPGLVLNIYPGPWSIVVVKSKFGLLVRHGDRLFKYYRVGIGRQNRTPVGTFRVNSKVPRPVWTPPGRPGVPFGNPENVLGTRWLGLQPIEKTDSTLKGFGIHGTWQPDSIGTAASEGCVRMKNDEVNELFDLVPIGTRVEIRDE
jgi:lipoprotein-anchoring transpeptidase ErfK/SrfK